MVVSRICDPHGVAVKQPVCDHEIGKSKKKWKSFGQEHVECSSKFESSVQAETQSGFECIGGVEEGKDSSDGAWVKGRGPGGGAAAVSLEVLARQREAEQSRLLALVRASLRSPPSVDFGGPIEHGGGGGWRAVLLASQQTVLSGWGRVAPWPAGTVFQRRPSSGPRWTPSATATPCPTAVVVAYGQRAPQRLGSRPLHERPLTPGASVWVGGSAAVPPPRPKVSASHHPVGSPEWQREFLAPAAAKDLAIPGWLRRQLAALGPYAEFWHVWAQEMSAPVAPPAAVSALVECPRGTGSAPWARPWSRLFALALVPGKQRLVAEAVRDWDTRCFSESDARRRAQTAGAAVLAAAGVPARSSMDWSPPAGFVPTADDIDNLHRLTAQRIQLPPRPPATKQEQPDRHPWEEDCLQSVAVVGVPRVSWAAAVGLLRVPVAWLVDGKGAWPLVYADCLWVQASWRPFVPSASAATDGPGGQAVWKACAWVQVFQPKCVIFDFPGSVLSPGHYALAGDAEAVLSSLARALGYEQSVEVAELTSFGIPMAASRCMVRWCARAFRDRWGSFSSVSASADVGIVDGSFDWGDDLARAGAMRREVYRVLPLPEPSTRPWVSGTTSLVDGAVPWFAGVLPAHHSWETEPVVGMYGRGAWRGRPLAPVERRWLVQHEVVVAAFFTDTCAFFASVWRFRPANCASIQDARARIGVPDAVRVRWRKAMLTLAHDHAVRCRNGDTALRKGEESRERPRHSSRFRDVDGHFPVAVPPEASGSADPACTKVLYYLETSWITNRREDIVPIQDWFTPAPRMDGVRLAALLSSSFSDQTLIGSSLHGVDLGNDCSVNHSVLVRNSATAERFHGYANEPKLEDHNFGDAVGFGIASSPAMWPLTTHKNGVVDKDVVSKRVTSNLSHKGVKPRPPWMKAPNDFELYEVCPYLPPFNIPMFGVWAQAMALSGVPPRTSWADFARWYKQFSVAAKAVPFHSSFWPSSDGPCISSSLVMLFGGVSCSIHAGRMTLALVDLLHAACEVIEPQDPKVRRWFWAMSWAVEQRDAGVVEWQDFEPFYSGAIAGICIDDSGALALPDWEDPYQRFFLSLSVHVNGHIQFKKAIASMEFAPMAVGLGVLIDLQVIGKFSFSMPEDKIVKGCRAISPLLAADKVDLESIEMIFGLLNWIAEVMDVRCRLAFLAVALKVASRYGQCRVVPALVGELQWWLEFLQSNTQRILLLEPRWVIDDDVESRMVPQTDASRARRTGGAGGVFRQWYWCLQWSQEELDCLDIMVLEAFACLLWLEWICEFHVDLIQGRRIRPWCDNEAFVRALERGRSSYPAIEWVIARLQMLQSLHSFRIWLRWVPSASNIIADAASRGQWDRLFKEMSTTGHHNFNSPLLQVSDQLSIKRRSISSTLITLVQSQHAMLAPL